MSKRKKTEDRYYTLYITPASKVGGEFPYPIHFNVKSTTKEQILAYADVCRRIGQFVRIDWKPKPFKSTVNPETSGKETHG